MEQIERRRFQILQRIAAAGQYISSNEIAEEMKVSAKTVRRDLEVLIQQAEYSKIYIQKKTGQGYYMDALSTARFQRMGVKALETKQRPTQGQRTHYMMRRLLAADGYIKSTNLADELYISQPIVSSELKTVRKILGGYELHIETVPGRGIRIQGAEQYLRSCMINEYWVGKQYCENLYAVSEFENFFAIENVDCKDILEVVTGVLASRGKKPYFISQNHMEKIAAAICLSANRSQHEMHFSSQEIYETKMLRTYQATCEILRNVSSQYGLQFLDEDYVYITNLILGYRTFLRFDEVSVKENFYRAVNCVNDVIIQTCNRYGVKEFAYDRELKERLALYLLSMEGRMVTHMLLENIISREMSRSFVVAREFATYVGSLLEKTYHCVLHHSEIDRLAMAFLPSIPKIKMNVRQNCSVAVVSQNYSRDIAAFIAQRHLNCYEGFVRQLLPYESYQLEDIIRSDCEFLLTDIPAKKFSGFSGNILYYSFSLSEEDNATIECLYYKKDITWARLKDFFHPELYFTDCKASGKKEVIELVSSCLVSSGYADAAIYEDLDRNSRRRFTVTNNGIGFVKTLHTYGERSFCAVFQFSKPVLWEGLQLQTLFVLGTGSAEPTDFLLFNGWMESLLQNECYPLSSRKTLPFDDLMATLHDYYMKH